MFLFAGTDVLRWRRLKQRLGTSLLPLIGIYSGYYHLDLSFPTDRVCLKKVRAIILILMYYSISAALRAVSCCPTCVKYIASKFRCDERSGLYICTFELCVFGPTV
jgi:hypothetical protein